MLFFIWELKMKVEGFFEAKGSIIFIDYGDTKVVG